MNRKNYPKNWDQIRQRILARAEHRCEVCGVQNYTVGYRIGNSQHIVPLIVGEEYSEANALRYRMQEAMQRKLIVVRLTVAHLDHDEWNEDIQDERLACLCEKHHFNYDQEDNQNRKAYGKQYRRLQIEINFLKI